MQIGIIGAGNIGGNLTRRLTALGHRVTVANSRGPETLDALVAETGATAATASEAARDARIVVVTVPLKSVPDLPSGFLDHAADGAVVIDTGNYYPQRDGRIAEIEDGLPESRWTESRIGHPVVKAFNGTYAQDILDRGRPQGTPGRAGAPCRGGRRGGEEGRTGSHRRAGLRHGGQPSGLDESWRQQPGTPVYGNRGDRETILKALAAASPERAPEFRG